MRAKICNRKKKGRFVLPEDGWYHIEVTGEHENRDAGVIQVIDNRAVESMVRNFEPGATGMLIDQDHLSHDLDKKTNAKGWLMQVQNRGGELYGKIRWSDKGHKAVTGGRIRLFSTEYEPASMEKISNKRARPMRLDGLTLTNRPNNTGGVPISNRKKSGGGDDADAPTKKKTTMKNILKALGLDETASEGDALAKISELKKSKATAKNRVTELEGNLEKIHNREVDELMEEHAEFIGDDQDSKDYWKNGLLKNREATEKQLSSKSAAFAEKEPAKTPRLHNRKQSKTPAPVGGDNKQADAEEAQAKRITNRANELKSSSPGRDWGDCWSQAESEASAK